MAKQMDELSPERRFAEHMGVVGEQIGMPPMVARVLGWLLICEPAQQSIGQIGKALGVSRASVSIATRLLEAPGWIRRTPAPGARGYFFEVAPGAFERIPAAALFSLLRRTLEEGLAVLPDPDAERGSRLREARDFYAYVETEIPRLIDRYRELRTRGGLS
jgi:DNA-binding transcriptional regulator GbsR (MarR family)